ncbi:MAG: GlsB/YeaQ/YmgE family stress response membrane protein [Chloroflexaceae bacterium]|nr:GlsB/YeaQ/YmgE family stress response membrane protein [Chloroflexaceae bacterium]NJL34675.1 GlsB/YeaQ/YmgE family stress response membrane protein [Chloroflexaceae bacterium]NJO05226.1 GlsB/YeaQ/YmgE family stress response membrane protein [Chloroflexaceae bacterium]
MNFIVWIILGAIIGWLASLVMGTNRQQGLLLDIVVGIVGAFLGGLVFSLFGFGTSINEGNFSIPSLIVSFIGAVILLAIVKAVRRRTA